MRLFHFCDRKLYPYVTRVAQGTVWKSLNASGLYRCFVSQRQHCLVGGAKVLSVRFATRRGVRARSNVLWLRYLGSVIDRNRMTAEMSRIKKGNRTYCTHKRLVTSKLISKQTKNKLWITLIRPVGTYGCGTWTLSVRDVSSLLVFAVWCSSESRRVEDKK